MDKDHFEITVSVAVSPQFYAWVFGLKNYVTIVSYFDFDLKKQKHYMLCADTVRQLPEEQYVHLDDLLNQEVFSGLSIEIPELQGIDIDKVLAQRLEAEECWITDEDTVLIPLTV